MALELDSETQKKLLLDKLREHEAEYSEYVIFDPPLKANRSRFQGQLRKANIMCKIAAEKEQAKERAALLEEGEAALRKRRERFV